MDFWKQVGRENGAKIDPKRHRKSDGKMEGTMKRAEVARPLSTPSPLSPPTEGRVYIHFPVSVGHWERVKEGE